MIKLTLSRATQLLVAGNLALAFIVAGELLLPSSPGTAHAEATKDNAVALPDFGNTRVVAPPIAQFVDMMERPLFFPDRRMPEAEAAKAPAAPPTPLRLKLEGIALAGGSRVAVLRNLNGNGLLQLAEGESHEGWTLDALTSTSASFSRGAQQSELLLDPGTGARRP